MKRFLPLCFLLFPLTLAHAQPQAAPDAPVAAPLPEKLTIKPFAIEKNDLADLLAVERWRFSLQLPATHDRLKCRLELRNPNQSPILLREQEQEASKKVELDVSILPQGDSLSLAPTLMLYIKAQNFKADGTNGNGIGNRRAQQNPFKGLDFLNTIKTEGDVRADGNIVLLTVNREGGKSELVLVLTTSKAPKPPEQ